MEVKVKKVCDGALQWMVKIIAGLFVIFVLTFIYALYVTKGFHYV